MFVEKPVTNFNKRRPVVGVGTNDAKYRIGYVDGQEKHVKCPFYTVWKNMLHRCYHAAWQAKNITYLGCTVEESWKTFSVFRAWMETQDWQGKELDKDLLTWPNKHYGPQTCLFVTAEVNTVLSLRANDRGTCPLGVYAHTTKNGTSYVAQCSFGNGQVYLGSFKTVEEASAAYKKAKLGRIAMLAAKETNARVKQALLNLY